MSSIDQEVRCLWVFTVSVVEKPGPATNQAPGPEEKGEWGWARKFIEQVNIRT